LGKLALRKRTGRRPIYFVNEHAQRFKPTPHPVMQVDLDLLEKLGPDEGWKYLKTREELIAREASDPFRYGYIPPVWKRASELLEKHRELLVLGGNRSGKTEWAAKEALKIMYSKPGAVAWLFQTTAPNSIELMQPRVWKYMPPEWRNARKGQVTNITYSVKGGFTEAKFVAPNQSICIFRNYAQDPSTLEGGEIDFAWADELVPLDVLETLRFRLVDRNGKLAVTFTPVEGWSPTVADYLSGAKTITDTDAELLPLKNDKGEISGYDKVPIEQINPKQRPILYFHTQSNPWAGWSRMKKELQSETKEKILCRAYGVPTKAISGRFPLFNPKVHVIRASDVPQGTRYHWVDPASGKNWAMIWTVHDTAGRIVVYREWPDQTSYIEGVGYAGEWALPDGKKLDGKPGPAQQDFGFGLERYKDEILRVEGGEEIFERWMDSRYGHARTLAKESPTTLIDEMADLGMLFTATPGDSIDEGVSMINDALSYNPEKPVDARNQPKLYISENCKNVIYALQTYTAADGKRGSVKDWIDLCRYVVLSDAMNVEGDILRPTGGGSY
jgi:phage terminase large subunit-like protein